jgi:hypothetical protein
MAESEEKRVYIRLGGCNAPRWVKPLAGTDAANPFCFPGFSLHDELGFMVQAGLTPLEALQTATIKPAEFLGLTKTFGTVEKGKAADLSFATRECSGEHREDQTDRSSCIRWTLSGSKGTGRPTRECRRVCQRANSSTANPSWVPQRIRWRRCYSRGLVLSPTGLAMA